MLLCSHNTDLCSDHLSIFAAVTPSCASVATEDGSIVYASKELLTGGSGTASSSEDTTVQIKRLPTSPALCGASEQCIVSPRNMELPEDHSSTDLSVWSTLKSTDCGDCGVAVDYSAVVSALQECTLKDTTASLQQSACPTAACVASPSEGVHISIKTRKRVFMKNMLTC